jgi:hypothetical protein
VSYHVGSKALQPIPVKVTRSVASPRCLAAGEHNINTEIKPDTGGPQKLLSLLFFDRDTGSPALAKPDTVEHAAGDPISRVMY